MTIYQGTELLPVVESLASTYFRIQRDKPRSAKTNPKPFLHLGLASAVSKGFEGQLRKLVPQPHRWPIETPSSYSGSAKSRIGSRPLLTKQARMNTKRQTRFHPWRSRATGIPSLSRLSMIISALSGSSLPL